MTDRREAILSRLLDVLAGVDGVVLAARNRAEVSESRRPAIILLDADDEADEAIRGRGRPAFGPSRVEMTPEIWLLAGGAENNAGSELNTLRARIVRAVSTDAGLQALCLDGDIFYAGCNSRFAAGRQIEGDMLIRFAFSYILNPQEL